MRITAVLPMCRPYRIQAMADQFAQVDTHNIDLDILLVVDNSEIIRQELESVYDNLSYNYQIIYTDRVAPGEFSMGERRARIADNLNIARDTIGNPDYVWLLEDDTQYPVETLQTLKKGSGVRSGIQAGRHGIKMCGIWDIGPNHFQSILPNQYQITACDAVGLYCALIPKKTFKDTPFRYDNGPVGPDVLWGYDLKLAGHTSMTAINNLKLGHVTYDHTIYPEDMRTIRFEKDQDDIWQTTII